MKIAIIIPIYKNGKHEEINNYRPISLLPQFSKIFEKIVSKKMLLFIDRNNIFYKNQYGFIAKSSTVHAYIHNYNFLTSGFQKNNKIASIFLDLKKAFDTVNHDILFKKLEYYGLRSKSMTLLKSYLSNRCQVTKLGENTSSKLNINIGVPQGSILGQILFILYINDIHKCLDISDDRNLILVADDTSLSIHKYNNIDLTNQLISDVNALYEWLNLNKFKLNTAKTKILVYKGASLTSNICIERQPLSLCKTYNFLGVVLDTKLYFK